MRYKFEIADVIRAEREREAFNGSFNGFNSFNGGTDKTIVNSPFRFDIKESDIPSFKDNKCYVELKAAEDVIVKSIWKGFFGAANTGLNNFANSINKWFNGGYKDQVQINTNEPFMPTLIHTGIKCTMPKNEVMDINIYQDNGLLIAGGTRVYTGGYEIVIPMYNIFPSDIKVSKGQTIAIATFHRVEIEDTVEDAVENNISNSGSKINLSKEETNE